MDIRSKLTELGLTLPKPPMPVATYVPAVLAGNLVFVSGQLPMSEGKLIAKGPVPSAVSLEDAQKAARQCVLNALSIVGEQIEGDWSRLARIVRLAVFVSSDNAFTDQPKVANGASDLLGQLFGAAGTHARVAVGVNVLPLGATVEIELVAQIK